MHASDELKDAINSGALWVDYINLDDAVEIGKARWSILVFLSRRFLPNLNACLLFETNKN